MSVELDTGLSVLIGGILVLAGIQKLRDPRPLAITLRQLYPSVRSRGTRLAGWLAVAVAGVEIVVGLAGAVLRGPAGLAAAGTMIALCVGFLLALRRALRVGAGCSCFGRLSRTAVGGRELGRAVGLVTVADAVAVLRIAQPGGPPAVGVPTLVAIAGGAGVVLLAMVLGERLRPAQGPAGPALLDVIAFNGSLYATAAARLRAPATPASRLTGAALLRAAQAVRAAPETAAILGGPRAEPCGNPLWPKANAALNPGSGHTFISIPTDSGCLLVATLGEDRLDRVTVSVPPTLSGTRP